jgi:hypothetical protein
MKTRCALAIVLLGLATLTPYARADELEDRFTTVWESLWTQAGSPTRVIRWSDEVRVRITGSDVARYRDHVLGALQSATEAAGLSLRDVSAEANAAELANLEFRIAGEYELQDNTPCVTSLQRWRQWKLEKVLVQARVQQVWTCAHHEVMHAMGIRGHPSGKTVLSYFPYRRDVLMPLDILMLNAWYSERMKPGATPFEALQVLTDFVTEAIADESERSAARTSQASFLRKTLQGMEHYARGEGEVPRIVFRSGRATNQAMNAGQLQMAYFIGVAYTQGVGVPRDDAQAQRWYKLAADKGVAAADRTKAESTQ